MLHQLKNCKVLLLKEKIDNKNNKADAAKRYNFKAKQFFLIFYNFYNTCKNAMFTLKHDWYSPYLNPIFSDYLSLTCISHINVQWSGVSTIS